MANPLELFHVLTFALLSFLLSSTTAAAPTSTGIACSQLSKPSVPGAEVLSIQAQYLSNFSVEAYPPLLNTNITGLNICSVDIVLSHHGANDTVKVKIWLPANATGWNGRFLGTGGSGFAAGLLEYSLAPVVELGYAAASTDAGLSGNPLTPAAWALDAKGNVNQDLLLNFASRSVHDMAVVGKLVTAQYYGTEPQYSYFEGCSTGGRQGLMSAQMHPGDFDGVVAGAPAIDWARYVVAEQWPQVVMREEGTYVSPCVLKAFTNASVEACDKLDGVADGVISDVAGCKFDPLSLVGTVVGCGDGTEETVSKEVASVVGKILAGPSLGSGVTHDYALNSGAALDSLANTTIVNGSRVGVPFFVNDAWIKYFVKKNPAFDTTTIGYAVFRDIFNQSQQEYGKIIGSYDPDLSHFRASGGKAIVWHGLADQLIFPADTIDYHRRVEKAIGNSTAVAKFYRTFLAPGVDHCAGSGRGAVPLDPLAALVAWVEDAKAPDVLKARQEERDGSIVGRDVCAWPLVSRYRGGEGGLGGSYVCV